VPFSLRDLTEVNLQRKVTKQNNGMDVAVDQDALRARHIVVGVMCECDV